MQFRMFIRSFIRIFALNLTYYINNTAMNTPKNYVAPTMEVICLEPVQMIAASSEGWGEVDGGKANAWNGYNDDTLWDM